MKKNILIVFAVLVGIGAMAALGRSGSSESFSARLNTSGNSTVVTAQPNANTAPAATVQKNPKVKVPKKNQSSVPAALPAPTVPASPEPAKQPITGENNEAALAPAPETKPEPAVLPAAVSAQPPSAVEPAPALTAPAFKKIEIHENPEPELYESFNCGSNVYNCGDFSSHEEAQRVFEYCMKVAGRDVHGLDGDNDGSACEETPRATEKVAPEAPSIESSSGTSPTPSLGGCCKYCTKGKACGDSCISRSYTCHKAPGCACDS